MNRKFEGSGLKDPAGNDIDLWDHKLAGEMKDIPPNWSPVFSVADSDETDAKARELGGTALMLGMDLPEIGRRAVIQDPTGAVFQILQPPPE